MKVCVVTGTRPEIIKLSSIVSKLSKRNDIDFEFLHTGQHYDWEMWEVFIDELKLPKPHQFLGVKSGTHGKQLAKVIQRVESVLRASKPDIVVVEGDTNSALGAALAAQTLGISVAHVEAGCRSHDFSMPEEINRRLISQCATLNFCPTKNTAENLLAEGILPDQIFLTGHPLVDVLYKSLDAASKSDVLERLSVSPREYLCLTIHRAENVENFEKMLNIFKALKEIGKEIVFPIHPRTRKSLKKFGLWPPPKNVKATPPLSYFDMIKLVKNAEYVLTDSGGIQQESFLLEVPCITLRENTEWVETVILGGNFLTGTSYDRILLAVKKVEENLREIRATIGKHKKVFGEKGVTDKILQILLDIDLIQKVKTKGFRRKLSKMSEFGLPELVAKKAEDITSENKDAIIQLVFDPDGRPHLLKKRSTVKKGSTLILYRFRQLSYNH